MIDALALSLSLWTHPGSAPCATAAGNPCWTGPIPTQAGEICDGDLILNTGSRDGRMIGPFPQLVALDVAHLIERGYRFRILDDGRTCIPTLTDGARHLVEACGNRAEVIAANSITGAVLRPTEHMRGGLVPVMSRTRGGASAHVAPPHVPDVPLPASAGLLLAALAMLGLAGLRRRA
jgi:hypothetical protein